MMQKFALHGVQGALICELVTLVPSSSSQRWAKPFQILSPTRVGLICLSTRPPHASECWASWSDWLCWNNSYPQAGGQCQLGSQSHLPGICASTTVSHTRQVSFRASLWWRPRWLGLAACRGTKHRSTLDWQYPTWVLCIPGSQPPTTVPLVPCQPRWSRKV